jgi:hypothetical protein
MVHAFNMVLGEHMFLGEAVLRHVHTLENTLSTRIEQAVAAQSRPMPRLNLQQFYTPNQGKFSAIITTSSTDKTGTWAQYIF